jgi:hypothetical protein
MLLLALTVIKLGKPEQIRAITKLNELTKEESI